jgi:hypothetical protein
MVKVKVNGRGRKRGPRGNKEGEEGQVGNAECGQFAMIYVL